MSARYGPDQLKDPVSEKGCTDFRDILSADSPLSHAVTDQLLRLREDVHHILSHSLEKEVQDRSVYGEAGLLKEARCPAPQHLGRDFLAVEHESVLLDGLVQFFALVRGFLHKNKRRRFRDLWYKCRKSIGFNTGLFRKKDCILQKDHSSVRKKRKRLRLVDHLSGSYIHTGIDREIHLVPVSQQCRAEPVPVLQAQISLGPAYKIDPPEISFF